LVTVGLVEDIRKQAQPHSRICVVVLSRGEELIHWLETREGMSDIQKHGERIEFTHTGDRTSEAVLLREAIQAGFEVAEFRSQQKTLEELFLHVTKGQIQ
jgi:ABC-2 type transport system ATP-binding protein